MDWEEGVGESSSPPRTLDSVAGGGGGETEGGGAYDVRHHVYNKLLQSGNEEVVGNPELLREMLETHFNTLPSSYGLDINMDKVEDVLLHRDLLAKAKDPDKRPVYHVRLLELNSGTTRVDDTADQQISNPTSTSNLLCNIDNEGIALPRSRPKISFIPSYEIIFSTLDKPKLLSQLSALLSDIGLNIREAHVFSTTDGYSLSVFVVDGWNAEKPNGLLEALEKAVDRRKVMLSKNSYDQSCMEKAICLEEESGDWEIDRGLVKIGEKIASGSYVDLYHGIYQDLDVAVKVFRSEDLDQKLKDEFTQEVYILRHVRHKNVVRFIGACSKSPHLWIVTEYMSVGSLYEYLRKGLTVLKLPQLLRFAIDISEGMEYLHQNNIIHRDLKTANLLIDAQNVVKVADFGIARFLNKGGVMTAETGTYRWMAPEIMNHQPYDQRADVYSFGIVLWELLTSKVPYDNMTPIQAAVGVNQGLRPQIPEDTHPKLLDLMQRCWQAAPDNRPSFSEIKAELEELLHEVEQTEEGAEVPKES